MARNLAGEGPRLVTQDSIKDIAESIARWVGAGGTQMPSGAFCGWRDLGAGRLSPPYPEITGYALGFLAQMPLTGAERTVAESASGWLMSRLRCGDLSARPEKTGSAVYTFDVAMMAHGLIRFGQANGDLEAVTAGLQAVEFLIAQTEAHGPLPTIVPGTAPGEPLSAWSTTGRVHLLKTVQALLSAHELGLTRARAVADRLVRQELRTWTSRTGPPLTCPRSNVIGLHALCYAAEGLWVWGTYHEDMDALRRSRDISAWVWQQRLPDGGFPGFVPIGGGTDVGRRRQSDVAAQAIRLAALHGMAAEAEVEAETALLVDGAWRDDSHAALCYWPDVRIWHLNCWASMFASQALSLRTGARRTLEWYELV